MLIKLIKQRTANINTLQANHIKGGLSAFRKIPIGI